MLLLLLALECGQVIGFFTFGKPSVKASVKFGEFRKDEERFILLGLSHALRVILVCHCYRSEGNVIRIISARKATPKESKSY